MHHSSSEIERADHELDGERCGWLSVEDYFVRLEAGGLAAVCAARRYSAGPASHCDTDRHGVGEHALAPARDCDGQPYCEQPGDPLIEGKEERGISLRDALNGGVGNFAYDYDFGDDWKHLIEVEERLDSFPKDRPLLLCIAGTNACPPEDFGAAYWCADQQEDLELHEGEEFNPRRITEDLQEHLQWSCDQGVV